MRLCRDAVSEMVGRWNETLIGELSSNSSQTSTHSLQSSPPYFLQRIAVSIPSTPTSQHFNSQPHLSTPTPSHHLPSLIPSRVSAFNIPETSNLNRPPTIDEARTWASTSTLPAQNATPTPTPFTSPTKSSSSFLHSSPTRWTKIETSYGHRMVDATSSFHPSSPPSSLNLEDEEMRVDTEMASQPMEEDSSSSSSAYSIRMGADSSMQMQLEEDIQPTLFNGVSSPPESYMVEGFAGSNSALTYASPPHLITPMAPGVSSPSKTWLALNVGGRTGHPHPYGGMC